MLLCLGSKDKLKYCFWNLETLFSIYSAKLKEENGYVATWPPKAPQAPHYKWYSDRLRLSTDGKGSEEGAQSIRESGKRGSDTVRSSTGGSSSKRESNRLSFSPKFKEETSILFGMTGNVEIRWKKRDATCLAAIQCEHRSQLCRP